MNDSRLMSEKNKPMMLVKDEESYKYQQHFNKKNLQWMTDWQEYHKLRFQVMIMIDFMTHRAEK